MQRCTFEDCASVKLEAVEGVFVCASIMQIALLLGEGPSGFRDYQEVRVQEQVQKLEVGKVSSVVSPCHVSLFHSLDCCLDSTLCVDDSGE